MLGRSTSQNVTWSNEVNKGSRHKPALHHVTPQKVYSLPKEEKPILPTKAPAIAVIERKQPPALVLEHKPATAAPPPASPPSWEKPKRAPAKPPPKLLFEPRKSGRPSLSDQLASFSAKTESVTAGIKQSLVKGEDLGKETAKLLAQCDRFVVGSVDGTFSSPVQFFDDRALYAFIHPTKERIDMRMMVCVPCFTNRLLTTTPLPDPLPSSLPVHNPAPAPPDEPAFPPQYKSMSDIHLDDAKMTFCYRVKRPAGTTFWRETRPPHSSHTLPCIRVPLCILPEFLLPNPNSHTAEWFKEDYDPLSPNHVLQIGFGAKKDWSSFKAKVVPLIRGLAA